MVGIQEKVNVSFLLKTAPSRGGFLIIITLVFVQITDYC
jgi:hypothetical protein